MTALLIGMLLPSAAMAAPFEWGGLNVTDTFDRTSPIVRECRQLRADRIMCKLTRTSFADAPITGSSVAFYNGRLMLLRVASRSEYWNGVLESATAKYGQPKITSEMAPGRGGKPEKVTSAEWQFDDGRLSLVKDSIDMSLFFFSNIRVPPAGPNVDF